MESETNRDGREVVAVVNLRHVAALALLLLTSCGPSIQQSTTRAETAADRAELAATQAEHAADQAFNASVQALKAADEADTDVRRANDSVIRLEPSRVPYCERLEKPIRGFEPYWCMMGPPVKGGSDSESIDWSAPRSRFCISDIFYTRRECHESLRDARRFYLQERRAWRARNPHEKYVPFGRFCAACANDGDDDEE